MNAASIRVIPPVRSLRVSMIFLFAAVLVVALPLFTNIYLYTLVFLMAFLTVAPVWHDWLNNRLDYFEPIHLTNILCFLYFGIGSIWTVNDPSNVAYDLYIVPYIPRAALYSLLGWAAMLYGYYWFWRKRPAVQPNAEWPRGTLFLVVSGVIGFVGYFALGLLDRALVLGQGVNTLIATASQFSMVYIFAWALIWIVYFSDRSSRAIRQLLFWFYFPATAVLIFQFYGDKSLAMTLIGIPVICWWYVKRHIPWSLMILLLLILMFVVFPLYTTYRFADVELDQSTRVASSYETLESWDSDYFFEFTWRIVKRRMALINSVAVVIRDVDRWVPYAYGETIFMPILVFSVPRIFWPDKPLTLQGIEFGRLFRVTNFYSKDSHIAASMPGELYWNFHLPGVLIGMAVVGWLLRWLYRRYGELDGIDPIRQAIMVVVVIQVVHMGGALAPLFVGFSRTLILLELLRWAGRYLEMIDVVVAEENPAPVIDRQAA